MNRRGRSHRSYIYRKGNVLSLTRNERKAMSFIAKLIRIIGYIIIGICTGIGEVYRYASKRIENHRVLGKIGMDLDSIMELITNATPRQFEIFVGELFKYTGLYDTVETTKVSHDYGRDCVLTRTVGGRKEVTFVEVKHYKEENMVGREICQKLLGSCQMLHAQKAIVVTTGKYHKNAYEVASMVNNLELMDICDIKKMILNLNASQMSRTIMKTLN